MGALSWLCLTLHDLGYTSLHFVILPLWIGLLFGFLVLNEASQYLTDLGNYSSKNLITCVMYL